jgi:hypothetical protein
MATPISDAIVGLFNFFVWTQTAAVSLAGFSPCVADTAVDAGYVAVAVFLLLATVLNTEGEEIMMTAPNLAMYGIAEAAGKVALAAVAAWARGQMAAILFLSMCVVIAYVGIVWLPELRWHPGSPHEGAAVLGHALLGLSVAGSWVRSFGLFVHVVLSMIPCAK